MKRIPRIFQFSIPFTKILQVPPHERPLHIGDLIVNGTMFTFSDGSLLRNDAGDPVVEINWLQWQEELVTETFIQEFLPEMHSDIVAAAKNHANNIEVIQEISTENGVDEQDQSGIWMADQAERAIFDHENNY